MNLDGIDVFVKVIQTGSFSGAAQALSMPTTTVSGKVAALEKRLGVTLIQRTTRKLNLTQAGTQFYKHCVSALEELGNALNELNAGKIEPEGTLRLTTVPELGRSILPELLKGYLEAYPKMSVDLVMTNKVVDLIGENIDLALRIGHLKDSTLIAKKFMDVDMALWASPEYLKKKGRPRRIQDLNQHSFIRFDRLPEVLKLTNGSETHDFSPQGRLLVDDMEAVKVLTVKGFGLSAMPSFVAHPEEKSGELERVLPKWTWGKIPMSFVYPPQRFIPLKVRAFVEWAGKQGLAL